MSEDPIKKLLEIAKKHKAEKEIQGWVDDYVETAWVSHLDTVKGGENSFQTKLFESFGRSIVEVAHARSVRKLELQVVDYRVTLVFPSKKAKLEARKLGTVISDLP